MKTVYQQGVHARIAVVYLVLFFRVFRRTWLQLLGLLLTQIKRVRLLYRTENLRQKRRHMIPVFTRVRRTGSSSSTRVDEARKC